MAQRFSRDRGLSLVEMLVCISLIVLLIALLLPTLSTVQESFRAVHCMTKLKQIGMGHEAYSQDFRGFFPLTQYVNSSTGDDMLWPLTGKPQSYLQINPLDRSWSGPFMCPTYTISSRPRSTWDYNPVFLNTSYTVNRSMGQYIYDTGPTSYFTLNGTPWMRRPTNTRLITAPASKAVLVDGIYRDSMRLDYTSDPDGLMFVTNKLLNRHQNQTNNVLFFDNHVQRGNREELNTRAIEWWALPVVDSPPY